MKRVFLSVPNINDLHYRQEWMKEIGTMSYNAGYDLDLKGYDKKTGIIVKTDAEIVEWYNNWINKGPDKFYAYIISVDESEPIGEVYYYLDNGIHSMGIVIRDKYRGKGYSYLTLKELEEIAFERNNISELSDFIPSDRVGAINSFKKAGFVLSGRERVEKVFDNDVVSRELIITRDMYFID